MTQDDIVVMAVNAGLVKWEVLAYKGELEAFAKLVAAKEREECAKLCEEEKLNATHYLATTQSNWLAIKIRTK
jgi:hypothetical protein